MRALAFSVLAILALGLLVAGCSKTTTTTTAPTEAEKQLESSVTVTPVDEPMSDTTDLDNLDKDLEIQ